MKGTRDGGTTGPDTVHCRADVALDPTMRAGFRVSILRVSGSGA